MIRELQKWANLSEEQINRIKYVGNNENINFIYAAVKKNIISSRDYINFLSSYLKIPAVDPSVFEIPEYISSHLRRKYNCIPFYVKGKYLYLAMSDPDDIMAVDDIRFSTGMEPLVHVALPEKIRQMLDSSPEEGTKVSEDLQKYRTNNEDAPADVSTEKESEIEDSSVLDDAENAPVVKMVNMIITGALRKKASDIHIESYEESFRVRYRLDGVLQEVMKPPANLKPAIISRLKIMADLNIAEKRLPQDGRIKVRTPGGEKAEFRISVLPTLYGEKVVLRYLDKSALQLNMSELGFEPATLTSLQNVISCPYGMFLVTGPTGSGKTTTLYSVLSELNSKEVNISTAEDPVEFSLPGVNQVQIHESIGFTFASALRSFLRQDPDIILVGEIRDLETAQIAVKSALTGHLVLSTLHTNDAPSTINRFLNMGVEGFLLASALNGVMGQRLARKLCPTCRQVVQVDENMLKQLDVKEEQLRSADIYGPVGCKHCNGTGYKGRTGIFEMLEVTDEIRELILRGAAIQEIKDAAVSHGMITLRQSALNKLKQGIISVQEVLRVTGKD